MKKIITALTVVALTVSFAQERSQSQGKGGERTPPPEAISVCEGEEKGTSCTMESPRGDTVEGSCQNTPDLKYFACKPNNHRPRN